MPCCNGNRTNCGNRAEICPPPGNCCQVYNDTEIDLIKSDLGYTTFSSPPTSNEILTTFGTYPKYFHALLIFYHKMLKALKYGTVQAVVNWPSTAEGRIICGDMCLYWVAFNSISKPNNFRYAILAALQYREWLRLRETWKHGFLQKNFLAKPNEIGPYCCPFVFNVNKN